MHEINFTIAGNQDDPHGNPIPYARVISHLWRRESTRYMRWGEYVRQVYYLKHNKPLGQIDPKLRSEILRGITKIRPITINHATAQVELAVFWANEKHGDLDNIAKGILDALFTNDKNINSIKATCEKAADGKGRVEVKIIINGEQK